MKKILSLLVALGTIFAAGAAIAGVDTTPHEFGTAAYGMCEVCHVPHAASSVTDTRLWRTDRTIANDTTYDNSTVGQLCGTCHNGGILNATPNINGAIPSQQGSLAYDETNHDRDWTVLTGASPNLTDTQDTGIAAKPYASSTKIEGTLIECTSCHNPHQNAVRPFLRDNAYLGTGTISGVCADCHANRYSEIIFDGVTGTGDDNHPVNVLYTDNGGTGLDNDNTTFRLVPYTTLRVLVNPENNGTRPTWPLGGKFEGANTAAPANWNTEDIGCGTCHSVHDKATQTLAADATLHLLAADNTGVYAGLCEGCHGGPRNGTFSAYSQVGIGPDHPIDMLPGTGGGPGIDRWFVQAGATVRDERTSLVDKSWPRGSTGNIICTSCHSAHRSISSWEKLTRDNWSVAINTEDSFCTACHSSPSPLAHHSHESNSNSSLTCAQCHGGGSGAHNGFVFSVADNANQYSNLCAMCHLYTDLNGDPTTYTAAQATNWAQEDPAQLSPDALTLSGTNYEVHLGKGAGGSHYLGSFKNNSTTVWVKRTKWTYGRSKYGSTRATTLWGDPVLGSEDNGSYMICESCHSVLWNFGAMSTASTPTLTSGWENDLLLMDYRDDQLGGAAPRGVGSGLCVGCHNQTGFADGAVSHSVVQLPATVPIGTHPMTTWSVTRAVDSGRTITTLVTATADGTYADNANATAVSGGGAQANGESYPANRQMDCDSCHTPHEAAGDGSSTGLYNGCQSQPGVNLPVIIENSGPGALEYENLCLDCHNY